MAEPTTPAAPDAPAPKIRQLFISALFGLFLSLVATVVMLQVYVVPLLANHEQRIANLEAKVDELDQALMEDAELPEEGEEAPAVAADVDAGTPAPAPPAVDAGQP